MDQGRKKKKSGRSNWQGFNEVRAKRKLEKQMAANRAQQSPLNWSPEKRLRSKTSMPEIKRQLRPQRVFIPLVDQETQTALSLPTDKLVVEVTVAPRAASQDRHDQEDAEMQRKKMAQFLSEVSEEWGLNSESGCEEDLDLLSVKEEEASVEGECGCQPDVDRSDSVKEEEASVEGECGCYSQTLTEVTRLQTNRGWQKKAFWFGWLKNLPTKTSETKTTQDFFWFSFFAGCQVVLYHCLPCVMHCSWFVSSLLQTSLLPPSACLHMSFADDMSWPICGRVADMNRRPLSMWFWGRGLEVWLQRHGLSEVTDLKNEQTVLHLLAEDIRVSPEGITKTLISDVVSAASQCVNVVSGPNARPGGVFPLHQVCAGNDSGALRRFCCERLIEAAADLEARDARGEGL